MNDIIEKDLAGEMVSQSDQARFIKNIEIQ